MKKTLLIAALALLPSVALALPALVFDTTPGGAGGLISYDGVGGSAIGSGIGFVNIQGLDTPLNAGEVLDCVNCTLAFTTGANLGEGPTYVWAGGGTFVLTGDVPSLGLDDATLLSGSFIGTANTPGLAVGEAGGIFLGVGVDTKHEVLAAHYGLGPNDWLFGNTEIMLGTLTVDPVTGAFTGVPNQGDLVNVPIPEPATLLLLGTGLLGLAEWRRRAR